MTMVSNRKQRDLATPRTRKPFNDFLASGTSMLEGDLPAEYGRIETPEEVAEAAYSRDHRKVRITIVWDNPLSNLPIEEVLTHMRETGAALVLTVEALDR